MLHNQRWLYDITIPIPTFDLPSATIRSYNTGSIISVVGVGAKPGLWTLDWTMDWTLDWILDWILDSIIHGPEGIQKTKLVHNKYNTHT